MNWKAQPLVSYDVMINLIGGTGTKSGLKVKAKLDKRKYPIGIIISDEEMEKVNIKKEQFHGDWNYKILKSLE
jgi:1-aminocyclopropane-1-carboxylate deaminase/D-cysteine desulfhydrase-like pyridoxal-dependent ACC family enzyme